MVARIARVFPLLLAIVAAPAFADEPEMPYEATTVQSVQLTRWADSEVVVKAIPVGETVEVVAAHEGKLRVRVSTTFGWLVPEAISTDPVVDEEAGSDLFKLGAPPSLGGGLGGGLGGLGAPPPSLDGE